MSAPEPLFALLRYREIDTDTGRDRLPGENNISLHAWVETSHAITTDDANSAILRSLNKMNIMPRSAVGRPTAFHVTTSPGDSRGDIVLGC